MGGAIPSALSLVEGNVTAEWRNISVAYQELWKQFVGARNESAVLQIAPGFDPFGPDMVDFVRTLRGALDESVGNQAYLFSPLVVVYDVMVAINQRFPYILCGVFSSIFLIIGFTFRAAFVPVKLCLTVLFPMAAVYGVSVAVYQFGVLAFLNTAALRGTGGIYWANPVFTVTIMIGLALDYDIFLFARVLEFRKAGYDNHSAVVGALAVTGPTITAAGLIMSIAFSGLMLTDIAASQQIGFLMAFGVLVDTFLIRTCLVPAMLVLAGTANYWPQKLPPARLSLEDLKQRLALGEIGSDDSLTPTPNEALMTSMEVGHVAPGS